MQSLYAFNGTEGDDLSKDESFLFHSLDSMYDLYLSILALLSELHKKSKDYNEKLQKKLLSTDSDKNPNTKFQDNQVLSLITENTMVKDIIEKRKLNFWDLDFEYVDLLFKAILKSDLYKDYCHDNEVSFKNDKQFVLDIYTEIIAPNDKLYDFFEDKKLLTSVPESIRSSGLWELFQDTLLGHLLQVFLKGDDLGPSAYFA